MDYKSRILLMDDDDIIREILREMLEVIGFRVTCTRDGEMAYKEYLDAMDTDPYHLALLDLTVPGGIGGMECLTKIKDVDPNVIAVVSSGDSESVMPGEFESYGFKGQLNKPYDIEKMQAVITEVLGSAHG